MFTFRILKETVLNSDSNCDQTILFYLNILYVYQYLQSKNLISISACFIQNSLSLSDKS